MRTRMPEPPLNPLGDSGKGALPSVDPLLRVRGTLKLRKRLSHGGVSNRNWVLLVPTAWRHDSLSIDPRPFYPVPETELD